MKIIELKSSNIKRLKAVELALDVNKNLVLISGKNGAGKSSLIDSIWYALGGKKAAADKPIREGEEKAEIELNLEGFIVKRSFTDKGSYLTVLNKDGEKYSNPQEFLDYVIGTLAFDPLAFSRMEAKKQVQTLLEVLKVDFTEVETKVKDLSQERLMVGRDEKALAKHSEEIVEQARKDSVQFVDLPPLNTLLEEYSAAVREVDAYTAAQNEMKKIDEDIARLQARKTELANLKKPEKDVQKMKLDLDLLEERSKRFQDAKRILADVDAQEKKHAEYLELSEKIKGAEAEKAQKLSEIQMPIEGLGFDEDMVMLKGIPYSQLSSAEQLKVSMSIAMMANPKLRVILIRDGSLLDEENLKVVEEMAKDKDFQIWVERVGDDGEVGILIEDGSVKSIDGQPVPEPTNETPNEE